MNRRSAVEFKGDRRVHISLEVDDLERSIAFYRLLLGVDPVKTRSRYAKFEPTDPPLNLSLVESSQPASPHSERRGHFGVQVRSTDAVEAWVETFRAAELETRIEHQESCCYAVQDKVWVSDPDGNRWEVFVVTEADSARLERTSSDCCA